MKKILIAVAVLIFLAAAGLFSYALYNANSLITAYRPELEKAVSQSLGATVSLGEINTSVFPDTGFNIRNLQISSDDPNPLKLDNIEVKISLLPLLSGRLEVVKLSLIKPAITLLRSRQGISVQGLPKKPAASSEKQDNAPRKHSETREPVGTSPLSLKLEDFSIDDGFVEIKDVETGRSWQLKRLSLSSSLTVADDIVQLSRLEARGNALSAADFSLSASALDYGLASRKLRVGKLQAAVLGNVLDISGGFDARTGSGDFTLKSAAEGLLLEKFKPIWSQFPQIDALSLRGHVLPDLTVTLRDKLPPSAQGSITLKEISLQKEQLALSGLSGEMRLEQKTEAPALSCEALALKINNAPFSLSFALEAPQDRVLIRKLVMNGFDGSLNALAEYNLQTKEFQTALNGKGLEIGKMLAALKPSAPAPLSGTLHNFTADIRGQAQGTISQSLEGKASVDMRDGNLPGFNLAGLVLKNINNLPFLSGALLESVPAEQQSEVTSNSTPIKSLTGTMQISGGFLSTRNLNLLSTLFSLEASGKAGFDSSLDLSATILFNPQFSLAMAGRTKELKNLLDKQNRLVVPLAISGTPPAVIVLPDVSKLLQTGAGKVLQEKAGKALEKVLGGKGLGKLF